MSSFVPFAPALALAAGLAFATTVWPQAKDSVPPPARPSFAPPLERDIPDGPFGALVREGRALFMDSARLMPRYVGNVLTCANCHLDRGRMAGSAPMWASLPMFPAYRSKNDKVNTFVERMQGCFQFSMNGTPPPSESREILALTAYSHWMSTGAPVGIELEGRGYLAVPQPEGGHDIDRGRQVYAEQCALCHGADGAGQAVGADYVFPPLWGGKSYNWGAGMHRINTAAAFIQSSMPLGKGGTLTDREAWDVAAYINSHERPQDPRLVDGSVEQTRLRFHADDGVNLYGQRINGVLLGQGTK